MWKWCIWLSVVVAALLILVNGTMDAPVPIREGSVIGARHTGQWTRQSPGEGYRYVSYVYNSDAKLSKPCSQKITIQFRVNMCEDSQPIPVETYDTVCAPVDGEVLAILADRVNADTELLRNTCVQLSGYLQPWNSSEWGSFGGLGDVMMEALLRPPTKHAFIGEFIVEPWGFPAASVGVPVMEVGMYTSVFHDTSRTSDYRTLFRIASDGSFFWPGLLKDLLPLQFALLSDDKCTAIANDFKGQVESSGSIAKVSYFVNAGDAEGVRQFVREVIRQELRFVVALVSPLMVGYLLCAMWLEGVDHILQIIDLFPPGFIQIEVSECATKYANFNQLLVEDSASTLSLELNPYLAVDDDYFINLKSGSFPYSEGPRDLRGDVWTIPAPPDLIDSTCPADNDAALNASTLFRNLLNAPRGSQISCADIVVMGQAFTKSYVVQIAELCGAASCKYNLFSSSCRLSCFCRESPFLKTHIGLCTNQTEKFGIPDPRTLRCEGLSCRPTPFAFSSLSWLYDFYIFSLLNPSKSAFAERAAGHFLELTDGFWALIQGFACIERRYGAEGLARVVAYNYRDSWYSDEFISCMEEVEFQGVTGRKNFKVYHAPQPTYSQGIVYGSNAITKKSVMQGQYSASGIIMFEQNIYRNVSQCVNNLGIIYPWECSPGSEVIYHGFLDNKEVVPQGFPLNCQPGMYPLPLDEAPPADFAQLAMFNCQPCPPGTYNMYEGNGLCLPCEPGTFSVGNQTACSQCPMNTASDDRSSRTLRDGRQQRYGPRNCTVCSEGEVAPAGAEKCVKCAPGTSRDPNATECTFCLPGSYQSNEGRTSCEPCGALLSGSLSLRGARDAVECVCPAGTFIRPPIGCLPCQEGMVCEGGHVPQRQAAGYFAEAVDSDALAYSVVTCSDILECPSGPAGVCAEGRTGLACSSCKTQYTAGAHGECVECTRQDDWPFALLVLVVLGAGPFIYISLKADLCSKNLSSLTLAMTWGQVVAAVQSLASIGQLRVLWVSPVKDVLFSFQLLSFDVDMIKLGCILDTKDPVVPFALQLSAFPALSCMVLLVRSAARVFGRRLPWNSLFNMLGSLLNLLFISYTLVVMSPLRCLANPNGTESVANNRGIICWETSTHRALLALSIVGMIVYPFNALAIATYETLMFPSRMSSTRGLVVNKRYRFLFGRFKSERYYFALIYLFRNFLIAIVPAVFVRVPAVQFLVMAAIFNIHSSAHAALWPWRTLLSNVCDLFLCTSLVLVMISAAPSLQDADSHLLTGVIFAIFVFMLAVAALVLLQILHRKCVKGKCYGAFLSHHKVGAGILCRYIKILGARHTASQFFLDSDELDSLDLLLNTVRDDCKAIAVVLTAEYLTRMWCAGEIVTAHKNSVPTITIHCDGFVQPGPDGIDQILDVWTIEQYNTLASFGVLADMIKEAYTYLETLQPLCMPRFGTTYDQELVVLEMIEKCKLPRLLFSSINRYNSSSCTIMITGAADSSEGLSACYVFEALALHVLEEAMCVVRNRDEALKACESARCLAVLLSAGILQMTNFAEILLVASSIQEMEYVLINSDTSFTFPSLEMYHELEIHGLVRGHPTLGAEAGVKLSQAYRSLLSVLALPLTTLGAKALLESQVSEICRRRFVGKKSTKSPIKLSDCIEIASSMSDSSRVSV